MLRFLCSVISSRALFALLVLPSALAAQELRIPSGTLVDGTLVDDRSSSSLVSAVEAFEVPEAVLGALRTAREPIVVADFPVAPNQREPVRWEQVELWAEGAKIHVATAAGVTAMEPPRGQFFRGVGMRSGARLAGRLEHGRLVGIAYTNDLLYELRPFDEGGSGLQSIGLSATMSAADLEQTCANENEAINDGVFRLARGGGGAPPRPVTRNRREAGVAALDLGSVRGGVDKQMVIGVETDNSLWDKKGASTTALNNYIADLFQAMNVFYERDLGTRLVIGDTFHWPSSGPSDPYTNTSGASSALLAEVRNYWNANRGSVDRVFAMLLSGNSSSAYSSSGIASLGFDTYCGARGYSMTQVFTYSSGAGAADAMVVGHEIAHNAGSPHTHCYNPEVDQCSTAGSGCWSGSTSCPAGGRGTLMSYCHLGACGSSSNKLEFHPTVINQLSSEIEDAFPTCVEPLVGPDEIFIDGFETGGTQLWQ